MRKVYYLMAVLAVFFVATSCLNDSASVLDSGEDLTDLKEELDEYILNQIKASDAPFNWNLESDETLFKGMKFTENILVVGYERSAQGDNRNRDDLLQLIYDSERIEPSDLGQEDDVLIVKNDILGFMYIKVEKWETLKRIRNFDRISYLELSGYPLTVEKIKAFAASPDPLPSERSASVSTPTTSSRSMVLDPFLEDPDYPTQVTNFSGGTGTCMRRHNIDDVYRDHQIFGENIGIAVLDNGLLPEDYDFISGNGYGARQALGYYNPLWFLPFTEPDGYSPQQPDVLFISQFIEGQWLHGYEQNEQVLVLTPNATQYSVRASPLVMLIVPSQILGVINSVLAMADDPENKIISMSMGTIWYINHLANALDYYAEQGKIAVCAAGTSFIFIRDLIGVIFPADQPSTISATGIENREETDGEFIAGELSHYGPELDFCTENNTSSSEATSRLASMIGLVWSANPDLSREEVIDICIQSSHFFQQTGQRNIRFGWGTIDVLQAVELALAS